MHRVVAAALYFALIAPGGAQASGKALTASRFEAITRADLEKMRSGCSFAAFRGKELIAISVGEMDAPDAVPGKPRFWFRLDGKLTQMRGEAKKQDEKIQHLGVWTGTVAGHSLRIREGRRDPTFKNDGGGEAGTGRIEWTGGGMAVRWEAGC